MNHTTLVLLAVLVAATLVIATFAAVASPTFADSSKTVVKQSNKQKIYQNAIINLADQDATNDICILTGANCGRVVISPPPPPPPPPPPLDEVGCPEGTLYNVQLQEDLEDGTTIPEGTILCLPKKLGDQTATISTETPVDSITTIEVVVANPNISPCPQSPTPGFSLAQVESGDPGEPIGQDGTVCIKKQ